MAYARYQLRGHLRETLKKPLGRLITRVDGLKGNKLISVGDTVSDNLLRAGIQPQIVVYDNKVERRIIEPHATIREFAAEDITVENPPGTLTDEAFDALREALESGGRTKIHVVGEEDLTALAAISLSPAGWTVVYGQPGEGIVEVRIDKKAKDKVKKILEEMEGGD
ncbi:MAG: DUF359 domain-containing protein [Candidatus Altiarchaeota archaeon]